MRSLGLALTLALSGSAFADDWPQWFGPKRDGVWRENGILDKFPANGPKVVWEAKVGAGYAGPAVANGKVFLMDRTEVQARAGKERTVCFDQKTGAELWKHEYATEYTVGYPSGPRCTPTVDGDRVYCLGTMGHLHCYHAAKGDVIWSKNFAKDYEVKMNIWGFSAHPLVEGDKLICLVGGSKDRVVVAFDKKTGKELWASQGLESDAGYCSPMIYEIGGRRTLVIWHGRAVVGLDPETGKRYWSYPWEIRFALTAPVPQLLDGDRLFLTAFYNGPVMLKVGVESTPAVVWKGKGTGEMPTKTDGIHSIMPTPYAKDGHIYGVCSYGELRCIKADTGERVWMTRKATVGTATDEGKETRWGNAFLTPHGDRFFLFNERGELIIAKLTPKGYDEIDRTPIVPPTNKLAGRPTVWCHPAYAGKCLFVRNDEKLVCVNLAK